MDNRTIEQVRDNETKLIKELQQKENIIKKVRTCINDYANEDEDYSKIYNQEEKDILEILDKALDFRRDKE